VRLIACLVALALSAPAAAQPAPSLAVAIQSGQVGERFDGYMGFAVAPSAEVRRQVLGDALDLGLGLVDLDPNDPDRVVLVPPPALDAAGLTRLSIVLNYRHGLGMAPLHKR